jgi:hypothetical protein
MDLGSPYLTILNRYYDRCQFICKMDPGCYFVPEEGDVREAWHGVMSLWAPSVHVPVKRIGRFRDLTPSGKNRNQCSCSQVSFPAFWIPSHCRLRRGFWRSVGIHADDCELPPSSIPYPPSRFPSLFQSGYSALQSLPTSSVSIHILYLPLEHWRIVGAVNHLLF